MVQDPGTMKISHPLCYGMVNKNELFTTLNTAILLDRNLSETDTIIATKPSIFVKDQENFLQILLENLNFKRVLMASQCEMVLNNSFSSTNIVVNIGHVSYFYILIV